ncbi:MAG: hypothetical protein P4L74_03045 [Candidatus Doudnabacteria bacterium]|nr:hypothetical protein [Candidatus Doudnabacteria bacterium]
MSNFSPQLIVEIIQYHQKRYGITLTPGQAEEYLNSWADLWNVVARGSRRAPAGRAAPCPRYP